MAGAFYGGVEMKYIIDMSEGWKPGLHEKCAMQKTCIVTDVYDENGFPCPFANAVPVQTLAEYQAANPKRPTGNEVKEIYIVA